MALNLALCGFGRAGKMHFTTLRKSHRCRLKYIVDVSSQKEKIEEFLHEYNFDHVKVISAEEFEDTVLLDKAINGIIVTAPTYAHEDYVCKALKHGKGVFCEKPVADSLSAVIQCYDTAAKAGIPLFCAFNRRFDDAFVSVKDQVDAGAIGKIHTIRTVSRDSPLPSIEYLKVSNGFFHDSSVHDIDTICWVLGEDPIELYAQGHSNHPDVRSIQDIDTCAIVMKFRSGVIATIDQSRHSSYGYDQRMEVFGENGFLSVDNMPKVPVTLGTAKGISQAPHTYSFPTRYADAYQNEMMHFLDVLGDPSISLKVTKHDAVRATKLATACISSFTNKRAEILEAN